MPVFLEIKPNPNSPLGVFVNVYVKYLKALSGKYMLMQQSWGRHSVCLISRGSGPVSKKKKRKKVKKIMREIHCALCFGV